MPARRRPPLLASLLLVSLVAAGCRRAAEPPAQTAGEQAPAARPPRQALPPLTPATKPDVEKVAAVVKPFGGFATLPAGDELPAVRVEFRPAGPKEADVPEVARRLAETGVPVALRITSKPDLSVTAYTQLLGLPNLAEVWAYSDNLFAAIGQFDGTPRVERLIAGGPTLADVSPVAKLLNLRRLEISGPKLTTQGFDRLGELTELRTLRVRSQHLDGPSLAPIWSLTQLENLFIEGGAIADADLEPVARLTHLHSLLVVGPKVTKNAYKYLAGLPELKELNIPGRDTDASLAYLARLRGVTRYDIIGPDVTDAGLAHLRAMTWLRELNLDGTPKIGPEGMRAVADMPGLTRLTLQTGSSFTSDDRTGIKFTTNWLPPAGALDGLAGAKSLKRLDLWNATDAHLAPVPRVRSLEELHLRWTTLHGDPQLKWLATAGLTDAGLAHLAGATQLRAFTANQCRVSDAGLANLSKLQQLAELELSAPHTPGGPRLTDAGIEALARHRSLRRLGVAGSAVTERGLAKLAALPNLKYLDLSRTAITDKAVDVLLKFPQLEAVRIDSTKVTPAGAQRLRQAKKGLTVTGPNQTWGMRSN
jgi:hypothetical protein